MIVVKMYGGLGNQLFQYATAREVAARSGKELILDLSELDRTVDLPDARRFTLANEPISARLPNESEAVILAKYRGRIRRRLHSFRPLRLIVEKRPYRWDKRLSEVRCDSYLDGYWQSYKYFCGSRDAVRKELGIYSRAFKHPDAFFFEGSVGVHVRRGDYITNVKAAGHHGFVGLDYFQQAMAYMRSSISHARFIIFSDDVAWCREHLLGHGDVKLAVDVLGICDDVTEFRALSSCQHHIISNSSFSWWAAWLKQNETGITIAPKRWLLGSQLDTSDLIPGSWISL